MARLPPSGVTISTPFRNGPKPRVLTEADLRDVLTGLCPQTVFTKSDIERFYAKLKYILGLWSAEQYRLEIAPLVKKLTAFSKRLHEIACSLSGDETGLRDRSDTEIVLQLKKILALDPAVGSRSQADELVASFRKDAVKIAHACSVTAGDLKIRRGKSGRPPLEWHTEFRKLLLAIAERAGLKPQSWKDRDEGDRHGWLIEAAQKLETFFPPPMRSPGREASGKRLERANTRLKLKHRQNPPSS
jgi:hypothetical protein